MHPIFLIFSAFEIAGINPDAGWQNWIVGFGIFNLVAGYTTYGLLAHIVLKNNGGIGKSIYLLLLPLYWLLISLAGWRALLHLFVMPHQWEKTPHGLAKDAIPS